MLKYDKISDITLWMIEIFSGIRYAVCGLRKILNNRGYVKYTDYICIELRHTQIKF
jgi:hypothetical protein